jgi:hypothetical protein
VQIKEEVRNNYLAGSVISFLGSIILNSNGVARKQDPELFNPYLEQAITKIDTVLLPIEQRTNKGDRFAHKIYNEWRRALYADNSSGLADAVASLSNYLKTEQPVLDETFQAKLVAARQIYAGRGFVREQAFDLNDIIAGMGDVNYAEIAPAFIEVKDGELVEPAAWNLLDVVEKTGAKSLMHDFPYYATWDDDNSLEMLGNLMEDLTKLQQET